MKRLVALLLAALFFLSSVALAQNPDKEREKMCKRFDCSVSKIGDRKVGDDWSWKTYGTEQRLGMQALDEIKAHLVVNEDPALQHRLNRVGKKIAEYTDWPGFADRAFWKFGVVDAFVDADGKRYEKPNAVALPGGYIYITRSMLEIATDNELAGVVAHEMAHVGFRHGSKNLRRGIWIMLLAIGTAAATDRLVGNHTPAGQLILLGGQFGFLSILGHYSKKDEQQADFYAVQYLWAAKIPPDSLASFMEKLIRLEGNSGGGILADHPSLSSRAAMMRKEIELLGLK